VRVCQIAAVDFVASKAFWLGMIERYIELLWFFWGVCKKRSVPPQK